MNLLERNPKYFCQKFKYIFHFSHERNHTKFYITYEKNNLSAAVGALDIALRGERIHN